jgi:hypothetical protein
MRKTALILLALVLAGCGATPQPKRVPDVRGQRLDVAEARLDARGLQWEEVGGGVFGVVVRSHWYVEDQIPQPGKRATTVRLVVERNCDDWDCD